MLGPNSFLELKDSTMRNIIVPLDFHAPRSPWRAVLRGSLRSHLSMTRSNNSVTLRSYPGLVPGERLEGRRASIAPQSRKADAIARLLKQARAESARGVGATATATSVSRRISAAPLPVPRTLRNGDPAPLGWSASNTSSPRSLRRPSRMRTRLHPRPVCPCAVNSWPSGPEECEKHERSPAVSLDKWGTQKLDSSPRNRI